MLDVIECIDIVSDLKNKETKQIEINKSNALQILSLFR